MAFPSLKLGYFDCPGRAETSRLAFTLADIPFEDVRVQRGDWMALKPTLPYKQLPFLQVDGRVVCQSRAISRYAATLAGLYPKNDPWNACRVDELNDFIQEIVIALSTVVDENDPVKKKELSDGLAKERLPAMLSLLEARLASTESKGPWFLDTMTLADLEVYSLVSVFKSGFVDYMPTDMCDAYARTIAIYDAVASHPKVAAWNLAHGQ
ncbi:hypothetical protein AC1031_012141 [Aphanomyces cochlioides]|nr:hypothetical protein AC1031_012141 [Aphanomyces cochlioides]